MTPNPTAFAAPRWGALLLGAVLWVNSWTDAARADWRDTCETPDPSWTLIDRDCQAFRERAHKRQFQDAHAGQGCEHVSLTADYGTFVHYGVVTDPCRVIDELSISVWVRSSRPGIQLLASVVLPRTINPRDGKPIRTVVRGSVYQDVGTWQQLALQQPQRLLRQQEASLRFQFGSSLDIREAYVDLIVLNAFGGRGDTELWIDDLEVTGQVSVDVAKVPASETPGSASLPSLQYRGTELRAGTQPTFLRIIEHNGEPLAWLQALGFNCVRLGRPAERAVLAEAKELGLWILAPPSALDPGAGESLAAWDLGDGLSEDDADRIRSLAQQQLQSERRIPLAGCPSEQVRRYADLLDLVIMEVPTIGSGWELHELGSALRRQAHAAGIAAPFFAAIPTEPPAALQAQWRAAPGAAAAEVQETWLESEQLRLLAVQAAVSGARGLVFRSQSRLDADSGVARLRARSLELINLDLQLLEPFLSGGRAVGPLDVGDSHLVGYGLETDRAQLLVACRHSAEQQFAVSSFTEQPVTMVVPALSSSASAYQLTAAGLQQVSANRIAGGLEIHLEHMGLTTAVVLTQENVVLSRLAQVALQQRQRRAELMLELLSQSFELLEQVRVTRPSNDSVHLRRVGDAAARMEQAGQLLALRDFRALEVQVNQGLNALAAVRRDWWEEAARAFVSPAASPNCALFSSLAGHWALAEQLRGRNWTGNALVGGDMEDLPRLLGSGWLRHTGASTSVVTDVQLAFDDPRTGRASLRMQAGPQQAPLGASPPHQPPLVIQTPPIPVRRGQMVQIRGWARVAAGSEPVALRVHESLAGPLLGERITSTQGWRPWTLYRFVAADGALTVHLELEGFGTVWVDDVSVHLLDLAASPAPQNGGMLPSAARPDYDARQ